MGSLASSSNTYNHPTHPPPPPFLRLPLIISESLRSAVSSDDSSTQGIVSILLSGADLVKLDLSNLQLFCVDGLTMEASSSQPAVSFESTPTDAELSPLDDNFSFQTPLILSPVSNLPPNAVAFPILKSKGVVDAEKASAEHNLLKLGAVSPSPRARKKAVSMDEMSLNEQLSRFDILPSENLAGGRKDNGDSITGRGYRAKTQLPALELAPLPCPGLEQKAETLKKKHFERVLSRKLSEVSNEEARIDLKASPAAKFLLQVMPWELTPPITPVTTPAAIPFIWEDFPGKPKPRFLPSPCPSLPLPPRLLRAPASSSPPSSDSTQHAPNGEEKQASYGWTHRKNTHSWHVLHNIFSGSHQGLPLNIKGACPENNKSCKETTEDGPEVVWLGAHQSDSDGVSCLTSTGNSSNLSSGNGTSLQDELGSREPSLSSKYELPPLYVAPLVPVTQPHKGLAPLADNSPKKRHRFGYFSKLFHKGQGQRPDSFISASFFNRFNKHGKVSSESNSSLLDDGKEFEAHISTVGHDVHAEEYHHHSQLKRNNQNIPVQKLSPLASNLYRLSPLDSTLYQSPKPGKPRHHRASRSTRFFIRLRRRGTRVVVVSYRAIKRALFLRRGSQSKFSDHSRLPYHSLQR